MRAGKLHHQITIQQANETQGPTGEMAISWSDFATVWASVEPLRGREFWAAKEQQAQVDTRIRMRYQTGITPKMQVVFGARTYLIYAVINPEMRNIELQLMCQEVVET